ncbi:DUF4232 domain-containing protein [Nocardia ninae]|uniref:DUF4232 domain-containing protein n=1 Tax=Nocardia ninae NBRC 108245 TaxID=1210091 RepID=A0A511MK21_9NOCA|nr:DUF4232 domain-containing protein [Nocardia ninae]GEM40939.1 hypothetical protein NN4_54580 [Nocardia ninae NBRC 108245]
MRIKPLIVAGFAAGVVITASGCGLNSTPGAPPTRTPLPSAQTGQTTQPGRTTEPGGSVPEATAAPAPVPAPAPATRTAVADPTTPADTAPPKCVTAQLRLDKGVGGPVGGTWFLRFINSSSRTCVLQGFPGISQTNGPTGEPVGEPAVRDQGPQAPKPAPVTLAPDGAAQFEFISYPKQINECAALRTNTLRVYPPDNTESLWLPWDNLICPSPQRMLVVRAITPM